MTSPCYVDSSRRGRPVLEELERLDVKNRRPTPVSLQRDLIDHIRQRLNHWDALVAHRPSRRSQLRRPHHARTPRYRRRARLPA